MRLDDDDVDLTLQHAIADGDRLALGDLYDRYAAVLLALAEAIVGPSIEAEEMLHDLFLEMWRHAGRAPGRDTGGRGSLRVWLFARMRERCLQQRRLHPELAVAAGHTPLLPGHWRPRGRFDVPDGVDAHLTPLRARVHGVLGELGHDVRTCLRLILWEGLTVPELARRTCSSERAVMGRFARAQRAFAHGLRGEWP